MNETELGIFNGYASHGQGMTKEEFTSLREMQEKKCSEFKDCFNNDTPCESCIYNVNRIQSFKKMMDGERNANGEAKEQFAG